MTTLAWIALALAAVPALLTAANLLLYRRPPRAPGPLPAVSVLIPARDEEATIGAAVESVLASPLPGGPAIKLEVVVMDDHSRDRTAEIVTSIAARDPRVRLAEAPPLPRGWCGKQHACCALAREARHETLVFLDADVRLERGGLEAVLAALESRGAALASGIPRQETGTLAEKLVIPLIHFLLLGFLPLWRMRRSRHPAYGAGCGQLMVARRDAYLEAGGHRAIRASRHDGIELPRAFRRSGFATDLFDATAAARCRMYRGAREVFLGFAKNAREGMATNAAIGPWTALLLGGQVLPPVLLAIAWLAPAPAALVPAAAATGLVFLTRFALAARFRSSLAGALLHPLGVLLVLGIQWYAFARSLAGRPIAWKGRVTA